MTLLEAPYGGEWWRGQGKSGEGWFPKSHVEYVDRETERKKAVEGLLIYYNNIIYDIICYFFL